MTSADRRTVARPAGVLAATLLAIMSGQMLAVVAHKNITVDEIVMIPAAYCHLACTVPLVNEHPPLSKILAGIPLLLMKPEQPSPDRTSAPPSESDAEAAYQRSFWTINAARFDALGFWSRVPMIALTLALGFLLYRFARDLFGPRVAVLAVAMFSLEPTVLAHGRVVQTDVPAAFGYLLFVMALHRYTPQPTSIRAAWLGAAAAVAILAKFSMLLTGLALAVFFLVRLWRAPRSSNRRSVIVSHAALAALATLLVVNAAYFFQHRPLVDADAQRISAFFGGRGGVIVPVANLLSQLWPADFVAGLRYQFWHNRVGHTAGLLGMHSERGWWYYFPIAFALKTTLPWLLLSLASLGYGSYQWIAHRDRRYLWLLGPFAAYTTFILFAHIDIGVRYCLPAYPFLFILSAALLDRLATARRTGAVLASALLLWMGAEAWRAYPNQVSYMNQLASRAPHWWYLSDSNVEWGDDIRALAAYLHERGESRVRDATLGGSFMLRYYGIERIDPLSARSQSATPPYTAVGASYLNGSTVPSQTSDGRILTGAERVDAFDDYRRRAPEAVIGGSIYLYRER